MILGELLGQSAALTLLERAVLSGRLPHAMLFHGPEGVGKRTAALRLAAALQCANREPHGDTPACGRCDACLQVAHGNHPDLFLVDRRPRKGAAATEEPDDEGDDDEVDASPAKGRAPLRNFIVVDQIREVTRHAGSSPRQGKVRVFVIDPADRMNTEAQNALLKTLEEPPGRSVLMLIASRPHALLPTVRSRCFRVPFGAMAVDGLAAALAASGMHAAEARTRAALAGGRPGYAKALDVAELTERREFVLGAIEKMAGGASGLAELAPLAKDLAGDDAADLAQSLDWIEALLRDAAVAAVGGGSPISADLAPRLAELGRNLGPARASTLMLSAGRLREQLRLNLNRTLVAEAMLAAIAGGPTPA
ncbi:MAG TPA: DNA polymerase III subunit delta' [Candidatus Polarisedimenticolaceae bacterium]